MKGARPRPWPAPGPPIPGCPREEGLVGEERGDWPACFKGAVGALGALGAYRWEILGGEGSLEPCRIGAMVQVKVEIFVRVVAALNP